MNEMKIEHNTVDIFGLDLLGSSKVKLLNILRNVLKSKNDIIFIFTPNAEQIVQMSSNPNFKRHLLQADFLLPDGISLVIASFLLSVVKRSKMLKQRITGVDLAKSLLENAQKNQQRVLIVGGREYQLQVASSELIDEASQLYQLQHQLYWTPGYQDYLHPSSQEELALTQIIQKLQPTVAMVAFGAPYQEEWAVLNRDLLNKAGVKIALTVGGSFDLIFGRLKRAPVLMRKIGLEWLFRLIQEPWRWRRQLRLFKFWWLFFTRELFKKTTN